MSFNSDLSKFLFAIIIIAANSGSGFSPIVSHSPSRTHNNI